MYKKLILKKLLEVRDALGLELPNIRIIHPHGFHACWYICNRSIPIQNRLLKAIAQLTQRLRQIDLCLQIIPDSKGMVHGPYHILRKQNRPKPDYPQNNTQSPRKARVTYNPFCHWLSKWGLISRPREFLISVPLLSLICTHPACRERLDNWPSNDSRLVEIWCHGRSGLVHVPSRNNNKGRSSRAWLAARTTKDQPLSQRK
jgi:hypothetical protein